MWILREMKPTPNGTIGTCYFKGICMGLFMECTTNMLEAKRFKTKKEAVETLAMTGRRLTNGWEAIRVTG